MKFIKKNCIHDVFNMCDKLCCTKCGFIWDCSNCIDNFNRNKMIYSYSFVYNKIYRKEYYCCDCHNKIGVIRAIYSSI